MTDGVRTQALVIIIKQVSNVLQTLLYERGSHVLAFLTLQLHLDRVIWSLDTRKSRSPRFRWVVVFAAERHCEDLVTEAAAAIGDFVLVSECENIGETGPGVHLCLTMPLQFDWAELPRRRRSLNFASKGEPASCRFSLLAMIHAQVLMRVDFECQRRRISHA